MVPNTNTASFLNELYNITITVNGITYSSLEEALASGDITATIEGKEILVINSNGSSTLSARSKKSSIAYIPEPIIKPGSNPYLSKRKRSGRNRYESVYFKH